MPEVTEVNPCNYTPPPTKWWQSSGVKSGLISIVCGIAMLMGYVVDADLKNKIEVMAVVLLPAIGAIVTGLHEIYKRVINNRCKPDIARKLL